MTIPLMGDPFPIVHIDRARMAPVVHMLLLMLRDDGLGRPAPPVAPVVEMAVVPKLGHIADRGDVDVGLLEQLLEIGDALSPRADDGHVEPITGRGSARSTQNSTRDNTG